MIPAPPVAGMHLVFSDEFDQLCIDSAKWVPWYLPHWSSRVAGAPRTGWTGERLVLQIEHDQQPWCPEFDGQVIGSLIQSGLFAGPLGSEIGQLRFSPACRVREEQVNRAPFLMHFGYLEIRCRAVRNSLNMCALWLMGYEDNPDQCGEICHFELKGWLMGDDHATIGYGIKPWRDPDLRDDFREETIPIDATGMHTYAMNWTEMGVDFLVDGRWIGRTEQSPAYPLQIMLGIYEFPREDGSRDAEDAYPKPFEIEFIRVWQGPEHVRPAGMPGVTS